jgi:hypothetical protein
MKQAMPETTSSPAQAHDTSADPVSVMEIDLGDWVQAHKAPTLADEQAPCADTQDMAQNQAPQPQDLVLSASRKIVLQCGLASITLHANGKVVLRGQSIVSAAEGINRLSGGQIEIN